MGTDVHLVAVDAPLSVVDAACRRIDALEQRWSRFRPDSELSRLNAAAGHPAVVSPETFALVERAIDGWYGTGGRFDPTVLGAIMGAGYDRSLELVPADAAGAGDVPSPRRVPDAVPAPGCRDIDLDATLPAITLPPGVGLDLGGVAKGWTADLIVDDLRRAGAAGACANLGGDLRVEGRSPDGRGWTIALEDPFGGPPLGALGLARGAVATTSRTRRRWRRGGEERHHVIDPARGRPAHLALASVTVVTGDAASAEILAKAAFVAGPDLGRTLIDATGAVAVFVDGRGRRTDVGPLQPYLVEENVVHEEKECNR